jgi:hypothetical protein
VADNNPFSGSGSFCELVSSHGSRFFLLSDPKNSRGH